jgi:hypothetical protein
MIVVSERYAKSIKSTNDETCVINRDEHGAAPNSVGRWCSRVTHDL